MTALACRRQPRDRDETLCLACRGVVMRVSSENLRGGGWQTRFMPGWWILPGLILGAATWAAAIWFFAAH